MKKQLTFCLILTFCAVKLCGQTGYTYTQLADSLLSPLNKTQATTGVLYDRVFPVAGLHVFNATDTSSFWHFFQAYGEMYDATFNKSGVPKSERIDSIAKNSYASGAVIPIGIMYYDFNYLDSNAIASNLFYRGSDSLLHDVTGRTGNPYKLKTITLAAALARDTVSLGTGVLKFKYESQLFFKNKSVTITTILADFGSGNQNITAGSVVNVTYSTTGKKTIKYTITYSNGSTATVYSKIFIKAGTANRYGSRVGADETRTISDLSYGYQGYGESVKKYNTGSYGIYYHRNTPDGPTENIIKKPIIIVDGFDPTDIRPVSEIYGVYLQYTATANFGNDMRNRGYDIIILNLPTMTIAGSERMQGGDFVQRNAFLLVALIEKINIELATNGSTEKLVVIGPSMGGLISRYALRWMENNSKNHNARLWISFDSPHQGANIPIGDQSFIDYFSSISKTAKKARDEKLNSAAARQMLLHHFSANTTLPTGAPGYRGNFQLELDNLGYPQNLRKIALVNGAINGTIQGTSCQNVISMKTDLVWRTLFIKAGLLRVASSVVSFTGSYGSSCQVFDGWALNWLNANKKFATAPSSSKSYDIIPGGYYNAQEEITDQDEYSTIFKVTASSNLSTRSSFTVSTPYHCFIPTFSALGMSLANKDLSENLYNRDLVCTGETPFNAYYAPQVNQEHITLTTENVAWITNEIEQIKQMSTVNYGVLYPIVKTAGTDPICASATYQINNLPAGSTVAWLSSNPAIATAPANGNPVTFTRVGIMSGTVTFTATVTRPCGDPVKLMKVLVVGSPSFPYSVTGASPASPSGGYTYTLQTTPANKVISNIVWTVPSGWNITLGQGTRNLKVTTGTASGNVQVSFKDACATSFGTFKFVTIGPGGPDPEFVDPGATTLLISPNPSGNIMNVSLPANSISRQIKTEMNSLPVIKDLILKDELGVIRRKVHYNSGVQSATINVQGLQPGVYFMNVYDGKIWRIKQVLISN